MFRPPQRPSPSPEINMLAIPKSNLEEEFCTMPPSVLEYVRNLERMAGKQSEVSQDGLPTAWPVAPKKHDRPHQRKRGLNRHVEYPAPSTSYSTPAAHTNSDDKTLNCETQYITDFHNSKCTEKLQVCRFCQIVINTT